MSAKPYLAVLLLSTLLLTACQKSEEPALPEQPRAASFTEEVTGEALFDERCRQCHVAGGKGGTIGPDLSGVGSRRDRAFLEAVIREPSKVYPGTVMPAYDTFSKGQVESLVEYLGTLR